MRILYHLWMSAECRKVRIVLHEKQLDFRLYAENIQERRPEFLVLNPAGEIPVLVESDGTVITGSNAITEFFDEVYPTPALIGNQAEIRAEVRRLIRWFDYKFYREVTKNIVVHFFNYFFFFCIYFFRRFKIFTTFVQTTNTTFWVFGLTN